MKKLLLSVAALFAINAQATDLSFNNFGLVYSQADFSCSTNCDGFGLQGSVEFSPMFSAGLDYTNYSGDFDVSYLTLGIRSEFSETAAVYGQLGLARASAGRAGSLNRSVAGVGLRGMLGERIEGDVLVRKVFLKGVDASVKLTGTYFFTDTVGGQLFVEGGGSDFGGGLGLRVNF
jgi:hypothetical protein